VLLVVFLALEQIGGIDGFLTSLPVEDWKATSEEYSWWFIVAFALYNIVFIGGNWAYVQRYTSVKNAKDAKKVGLTFGWIYLVSPFIWMLPPMIYKIINPDLSGLESEGAYMLICKQVLPIGMLGLMLGGMVFATASSVNTTLNLAASVITNDLFMVFKPKASLKQIMKVAKLSTILFGIGTILVALLVPYVGGIVNVVLSIGAVTGCSLYGPPIWALFSKRQSGKSVLMITVVSLAINIGFKFFATLSRADEMLLGTLSPFALLVFYEIVSKFNGIQQSEDFINYKNQETPNLSATSDVAQNLFGMKVLGNTLIAVGVLIAFLGVISQNSKTLIISIGMVIVCVAMLIHPKISIKKTIS
ncbi:MAG: sodium transporter, partial [Flavobacteriia bacterium]|nr:sodium transporter [Flavobacteriia bacterium]